MLDESMRTAILKLHEGGHGVRAIARALAGVARPRCGTVVRRGTAEVPRLVRPERADGHEADIRELYLSCRGNLVRVHEELTARGAVRVVPGADGLLPPPRHRLRAAEAGGAVPLRARRGDAARHLAAPGDDRRRRAAACRPRRSSSATRGCSSSSSTRPSTASRARCFSPTRLVYFGGAAGRCMIDNTHVVVLRGTGKEMVPVPEMAAFGERYGFEFVAHEVGDANRSARVERPFDFIEHNFLAGREFRDFAHLNREARAWCERVNGTPQATPAREPPRALRGRAAAAHAAADLGARGVRAAPAPRRPRGLRPRRRQHLLGALPARRPAGRGARDEGACPRLRGAAAGRRARAGPHLREASRDGPRAPAAARGVRRARPAVSARRERAGGCRAGARRVRRRAQETRHDALDGGAAAAVADVARLPAPRRCSPPSERPRTTASTTSIASSGWCCARSPATTSSRPDEPDDEELRR